MPNTVIFTATDPGRSGSRISMRLLLGLGPKIVVIVTYNVLLELVQSQDVNLVSSGGCLLLVVLPCFG